MRDFKRMQNDPPEGENGAPCDNDIMKWQVQVGSQKFPDNECVGVSESYFRLLQATGHEKNKDDTSITPTDYVAGAAIFGIDFEMADNEALFRGLAHAAAR